MSGLFADCRHAARLYMATPGMSLIVLLVLSVGMAFVVTFLSLYVDLGLRPHPEFHDSSEIVSVAQTNGTRTSPVTLAFVERAAQQVTSMQSLAGVSRLNGSIRSNNAERSLQLELVTRQFFDGLRPRLFMGRGFFPEEHDGAGTPVAVVSYTYWVQQLGRKEEIIGETISLIGTPQIGVYLDSNGVLHEPPERNEAVRIVGVMHPDIKGMLSDEVDMWLPLEWLAPVFIRPLEIIRTNSRDQYTFGRRAPGVDPDEITTELVARYVDNPDEYLLPGFSLVAIDGVVRNVEVHRAAVRQLGFALISSLLLMLVVTSNVSLLLLARAPARRRELAIRMTVGAPTKRLLRLLIAESALLMLLAAAVGLLLSVWLSESIQGLEFLSRANLQNVSLMDWRVLAGVGLVLCVLVLVVSLSPVLSLKQFAFFDVTRQFTSRASPAQRIAGAVQLAIACAFASAAIAFCWYLGAYLFGHPGYETNNLFAVEKSNQYDVVERADENLVVEIQRHRNAILALPGITDVSFGSILPGGQTSMTMHSMVSPTNPSDHIDYGVGYLDANLISMLGIEPIRGRNLINGATRELLVNQTMARRIWGRDDVVGEVLTVPDFGGARSEPGESTWQVVGVIADISFLHPAASIAPMILASRPLMLIGGFALIESTLSAQAVREALNVSTESGEIDTRFFDVVELSALRRNVMAQDRVRGLLTIGTGILVIALAALGYYGMQRYLVVSGRREYAIQAAMGAGPRAIVRLVVLRAIQIAVPGLLVGALLAYCAVLWLQDQYIPRDVPPALVSGLSVALLIVIVVAATIQPALQSAKEHPATALKDV